MSPPRLSRSTLAFHGALRAAEAGDVGGVKGWRQTMARPRKARLEQLVQAAALNGHAEVVRLLLPEAGLTEVAGQLLLKQTAQRNHVEAIGALLEAFPDSEARNITLASAIRHGHVDVVNLVREKLSIKEAYAHLTVAAAYGQLACMEALLPRAKRCVQDGGALMEAAKRGQLEIVQRLLPLVPGARQRHEALLGALQTDQVGVIDVLLPLVDAKAKRHMALRLAFGRGEREIIERIMAVSDPLAAAVSMIEDAKRGSDLAFHATKLVEGVVPFLSVEQRGVLLEKARAENFSCPGLERLVTRQTLEEGVENAPEPASRLRL